MSIVPWLKNTRIEFCDQKGNNRRNWHRADGYQNLFYSVTAVSVIFLNFGFYFCQNLKKYGKKNKEM